MASYDLILKNGTVWTPGGPVEADVGVQRRQDRRRSASSGDAGETIDCTGLDVLPGRDRQPGPFPRAGARGQGGSRKRQPRGGARRRHRGVRDAEHQAQHRQRRGASPTSWRAPTTGCGATMPSMSARPPPMPTQLGELERLPGTAGVKIFMGASTGDLLVAEDEELARVLASGKRRVAIHAEDEARMNARLGERVEGDPVAPSGVARRRERAARDAADPAAGARGAAAHPHPPRHHAGRARVDRASTRTSRPAR